jgi:hypothetical protein
MVHIRKHFLLTLITGVLGMLAEVPMRGAWTSSALLQAHQYAQKIQQSTLLPSYKQLYSVLQHPYVRLGIGITAIAAMSYGACRKLNSYTQKTANIIAEKLCPSYIASREIVCTPYNKLFHQNLLERFMQPHLQSFSYMCSFRSNHATDLLLKDLNRKPNSMYIAMNSQKIFGALIYQNLPLQTTVWIKDIFLLDKKDPHYYDTYQQLINYALKDLRSRQFETVDVAIDENEQPQNPYIKRLFIEAGFKQRPYTHWLSYRLQN